MAANPSARICLSYRRVDGHDYAGRLYDWLTGRFGGEIFKDIDTIALDTDFAEVITEAVKSCQVLVAVIGPRWLNATDEWGRPRLNNPDDFVRLELEAALESGLYIVVVLVGEAQMPRAAELPESLKGLARRNALHLRHESFHSDADRLLAVIEEVLSASASTGATVSSVKSTRDAEPKVKQEVQEDTGQRLRPRIFLCYRREDTQWVARSLYEMLSAKYGREQVFRDIDSTPAGVRYSTWIESRIAQCSVMIVLIGSSWSSAKDKAGLLRLESPKDWVRQEIEAGLRREIPIIPVCVQGARMPSEDELPPSIADLTGFQSAEITDSRWDFDVGRLLQAVGDLVAPGTDQ